MEGIEKVEKKVNSEGIPPNETLYVRNLNDKIKKDGMGNVIFG